MNRRFRLTRRADFQRVRRAGKSYAHPLVVLIALPGETAQTQVGVSASRLIGTAVQRNRAKRLIRAAISSFLPELTPGYQLLILARAPINRAVYGDVQREIGELLHRADLLKEMHGE